MSKKCPGCKKAITDLFPVRIIVDAGGGGERLAVCEECAVDKYGYCAFCLSPVAGLDDDFSARHDGICFDCWTYLSEMDY